MLVPDHCLSFYLTVKQMVPPLKDFVCSHDFSENGDLVIR